MATVLDKTLTRQVTVDGVDYTVVLDAKGDREPVGLTYYATRNTLRGR